MHLSRGRCFSFLIAALVLCTGFDAGAQTPLTELDRGYLENARRDSKSVDDAASRSARAHLAIRDGQLDEALRLAEDASARATLPEDRARAGVAHALVLELRGKNEEAEARLRSVLSERSSSHRARLELGRLLIESGRLNEGEVVLDTLVAFYRNGLLKSAEELVILGDAMRLLGSFQDANTAYHRALKTDEDHIQARIRLADLFVEKYNTADAEVLYEEVLERSSTQPDALVGLAVFELVVGNDFNKARNLLERAQMVEPAHPGALLARADIAINDSNCEDAKRYLDSVLSIRPVHLEAHSLHAACELLNDRPDEFEARVKKVLELNPQYVDVLVRTAHYLERVNRHDEVVELSRRALEIRPGFGPALLKLGVALSRTGHEDEAIDVLRQAYSADPYNVRAFNMVELYEKVMPEHEVVEHPRFRTRAHGSQIAAIDALVSPVVQESLEDFDRRYGFNPDQDLTVEVYSDPEVFGVRSVGVPHISPQGICFGKVVVSRSPAEGNFNWRSVIWHEMAHVYHVQMTEGRVPRWFTEGLAEYETNIKDRSWARYHDRELYEALASGNLKGVLELDKGFTHARTFEEILRSYHQASLVIHYLVETHGFDTIVKMLRAWGTRKTDQAVYEEVLGTSASEIDKGFEAWLERRYVRFKGQLAIDLASLGSAKEEREAAQKSDGDDSGFAWIRVAAAQQRDGDAVQARTNVDRAVKLAPKDPRVRYVAMLINFEQSRARDAYTHGQAVLDQGRDSYELRIILGLAARQLERLEEAMVHYRAATQLWPDGSQAWSQVGRLASLLDDQAIYDRALRRAFELEHMSPVVAERYGSAMLEAGRYTRALEAGKRWTDIAPLDGRSHAMVARAALMLDRDNEAMQAWQLWATVRPQQQTDVWLNAARLAGELGRDQLKEDALRRARDAGASERRIKRALESD